MHSFSWAFLIGAVLIVPALSVMPRLMLSAKTAIGIPLLSCLLLYLLKEIFYFFSIYNTFHFRALILLMAGVALIRCRRELRMGQLDWSQKEIFCYLSNFLLLLSLIIWFWTTPYDTDADAVTSWDMWAQQHYLGVRPDFFYTIYPYPQAFSVFISNIYTVWGSADDHQLARALFFIFPYCTLTIISLALAKKSHWVYAPLIFSAGLYLLFFFTSSHLTNPDPMMAASVVASAFYTLRWHQQQSNEDLLLSAACALLAILTKQQALFWTFLTWPALLLMSGRLNTAGRSIGLSIGVVMFLSGLWFYLEGGIFAAFNNRMAIGQAFDDRNVLDQILLGGLQVVLFYPITLILLAMVISMGFRNKAALLMAVFFVFPTLGLWILFGTYSVHRAGVHLIGVMALMVALDWERVSSILTPRFWKDKMVRQQLGVSAKAMAAVVAILFFVSFEVADRFRQYPLEGGHRNTLVMYFNETSPKVIDDFYYSPDIKMFTQNEMIDGIMVRKAKIARPPHGSTELDMLNLMASSQSQVVFPYPAYTDRTPLGITLGNLAWFCPQLLTPEIVDHGFDVYKIHHDQIDDCRHSLVTRKYFVTTEPVYLY